MTALHGLFILAALMAVTTVGLLVALGVLDARGADDERRLLGLLVAQDLLDLVHEFLQVRRQVDAVEN